MKRTKANMENQGFTCSNPECARVFANPIIVQDLSSKNRTSYPACPHCLTEIAAEKDRGLGVEEERQTQKTTSASPIKTIPQLKEVKLPEQPITIHKCPHHLGYLRQRSKNENIPEECMTCEKLLQCMYV